MCVFVVVENIVVASRSEMKWDFHRVRDHRQRFSTIRVPPKKELVLIQISVDSIGDDLLARNPNDIPTARANFTIVVIVV